MYLVDDYKKADAITHNGIFHLDEIAALNLYELAAGREIAVARLKEVPDDFKGVAIDIGDESGRTDIPIYDHHIAIGNEKEDEMSSCGKVFEAYKKEILPKLFGDKIDLNFAEKIFKSDILTPIQTSDTKGGAEFEKLNTKTQSGYLTDLKIKPLTLSSVYRQINPPFFEKEKTGEMFCQGYDLFKDILKNYSNLLVRNISEGYIKPHYNRPSNFYKFNYSFDETRIQELTLEQKINQLEANTKAVKRGYSINIDDERVLLMADIFCLKNSDLANKIFDMYQTGIEKNREGFELATQQITEKTKIVEKEEKNVLVLDEFMPWKAGVVRANNDYNRNANINFVVFPSLRDENEWYLSAVQDKADGKEFRIPIPEDLKQMSTTELAKHTNGEATFCSRFLMGCKSKEAAIRFGEIFSEQAKHLSFPEGTKSISAEDLNLPSGVYETLILPSSLEKIEDKTFTHCNSLTSVIIPENTAINTGAFSRCMNLREVEIKPGISNIGYYAFANCPKLEKVILPDTVRHISEVNFSESKPSEFLIKMTSFDNLKNIIKIGNNLSSDFPEAKIDIDCEHLGHNSFSFNDFKALMNKVITENFKEEQESNLAAEVSEKQTELNKSEEINNGISLSHSQFEYITTDSDLR